MIEQQRESVQHRQEVQAIKKSVRADQKGRGTYLPGLFACRLAAGLTQQELAERAGTGRGTVRSLEHGERRAQATTTRRLCEALAVSPADLLSAEAIEEK